MNSSMRRYFRTLTFIALAEVVLVGCGHLESSPLKHWFAPDAPPNDRFVLPPDTNVVGQLHVVYARKGDSLPDIARRFGLGYGELMAANPGVDPWLPERGTRIVLPTQFVLPDAPREGLVLNLSAMRLFFYPQPVAGEAPVVITHPIGIGREGWATPLGATEVVSKMVRPAWRVPASIRAEHLANGDPLPAVVPPGPDNPLGDFAMRLGKRSYLIHGTNQPYGIGMRVSHGCVRLYPDDIRGLFKAVAVGTKVRIVDQPYLVGWKAGMLYLEVHAPVEKNSGRSDYDLARLMKTMEKRGRAMRKPLDRGKAKQVVKHTHGLPVPISVGAPDLEELIDSATVVRNRRLPQEQVAYLR